MPDGEGGVDLYVSTQWLHVDRDQLAASLDLPPERVRITLAGVGGAFGAREDLSMQIHACLLALRTGRPVKILYSHEESFFGHVHRHPARLRYEHGATRDGRLVHVKARILLDGGAYASSSTAVCSNAACFAVGPYDVASATIDCTVVYTDNPPCGAMRRVRRRPDLLRLRGPDGPAGRRAGHRPSSCACATPWPPAAARPPARPSWAPPRWPSCCGGSRPCRCPSPRRPGRSTCACCPAGSPT
jgi:hypothetical protein